MIFIIAYWAPLCVKMVCNWQHYYYLPTPPFLAVKNLLSKTPNHENKPLLEEGLVPEYEPAGLGLLFLNLLIDTIFMRFSISLLVSFALASAMLMIDQQWA
ncbi:MAG TPA: hypothetical protein PKD90_02040 [Phnomibacter sp.]|nr:hypothetical protein [Phnomibacter sp.]